MKLHFHKYQATGNDFVLINGRDYPEASSLTTDQIRHLCDRHFGIGADGFMILAEEEGFDFRMDYYNSDGRPSSMCGNGGRSIVAFAFEQGWIGERCRFLAYDGLHEALYFPDKAWVELQMRPVAGIQQKDGYFFLDTGSPHHVQFVSDLDTIQVVDQGRAIRYGTYGDEGSNVNFVERIEDGIRMATYERGVENETLSCGTGVTAAALAFAHTQNRNEDKSVKVETKGGTLEVRFFQEEESFTDIWLCGPAQFVFEGMIKLNT